MALKPRKFDVEDSNILDLVTDAFTAKACAPAPSPRAPFCVRPITSRPAPPHHLASRPAPLPRVPPRPITSRPAHPIASRPANAKTTLLSMCPHTIRCS